MSMLHTQYICSYGRLAAPVHLHRVWKGPSIDVGAINYPNTFLHMENSKT